MRRMDINLEDRMRDGVTPRCKEVVDRPINGWPHYSQCTRSGKVETEDGWRCKQHSPAEVSRREQQSQEKWNREWNQRRKEIHGPRFLAVLEQIAAGHNDARGLAQGTIDDFRKGEK